MLHRVGKKPIDYIKGFPAQLVEVFDPTNTRKIFEAPTYEKLKDDWQNLLFHGDNKDVLATLLELGFRGKIGLIYIDPPFKSGADYVRKVKLRGLKKLGRIEEDEASILQQTMYFDIWNNDTYLQFMYERLVLIKELLANTGSIYVHLDWHVGHYIKLLMDEVFGEDNFKNEIVWCYKTREFSKRYWNRKHDIILLYTKSGSYTFNWEKVRMPLSENTRKKYKLVDEYGRKYRLVGRGIINSPIRSAKDVDPIWEKTHPELVVRDYLREGYPPEDWWLIDIVNQAANERVDFRTQKPQALLERVIKASSNEDDLVLDCFCGSGTTARVAQKLGRQWIGCDINKGAIHLTSRELQKIIVKQIEKKETKYPNFSIYKVNDYDLQLLKTEAIELTIQHIGIQRIRTDAFFDGYLGKNLVKIIDFNHPLTLLDLQLLQDELKKRPDEDRDITIVSLGKELVVDPWIDEWNKKHPVNKIRVIELKTDKKYGNFLIHKPAEAKIKVGRINKTKGLVEVQDFISPTIIERLNIDNKLFKVKIPDFRSMIDTVLIDNNYDGRTFHIVYSDVPERKDDLVKGKYEIEVPKSKVKAAVKIIDMLGEEVISVFEI